MKCAYYKLLFFLWSSFIINCGGGGGGGDVPLPVTGRVGETVTLTPRLTLTHPIDRVTWIFHFNGKIIILAEFRDQNFIRVNNNYFPNRLEGSNSGTALLIRELRMEDSGIFTARFLVNGERREISYILTIFDPVPTPDIKMEMEQISPDWCNFTLHCSAPTNPSALSYSWMYRHKGRYQPYPNGTTIRVSLQPESWDGEYLCLVQNPADQKNVSIAPREFCPHTRLTKATTDKSCGMKLYMYLPILTALSVSVAALIIVTRTKGEEQN
uniref:Ig-like domain-containing protein n=1 Tax=Xenopus tropicalis TaxID=8364 RepID=A0A7D9NKW5_XENTR